MASRMETAGKIVACLLVIRSQFAGFAERPNGGFGMSARRVRKPQGLPSSNAIRPYGNSALQKRQSGGWTSCSEVSQTKVIIGVARIRMTVDSCGEYPFGVFQMAGLQSQYSLLSALGFEQTAAHYERKQDEAH